MEDLLLLNYIPFSEKDEKPHIARLDDTAIPHIKIKITQIPLEKTLNSNTAIPSPCPPLYRKISIYSITYEPLLTTIL